MKSPFNPRSSVVPPLFVGRSESLSVLKTLIDDGKGHIAVAGDWGIGKSSLVKTHIHTHGPSETEHAYKEEGDVLK